MALDPNIILQARGVQLDSPLDTYGRVAQVQAARNQNRIADIAFQDRARAQAADSSLAQLLAAGKSGEDIVSGLAGGGFGSQAVAYQKTAQEQKKAAADLKKLDADTLEAQSKAAKASFDSIASTLGSLQAVPGGANPLMIQRALGHLSDIGVIKPKMVDKVLASAPQDPSQIPAWLDQQRNAAMSAKEQVAARQQDQVFGETKRSNMAREANSAGQLAVSRGNLGLAQQRLSFDRQAPRGQVVQTDAGPVLVDPRTGTGKAVTGPDGQRLAGVDKPLNDSQSKALLFGTRMQEANKALAGLSQEGVTSSTPGSRAAYVGGAINALSSNNNQALNQAKTDFLSAVLRRESGAAIANSEYDNADKQYFPQIGDKPEVVAQKARNRELAINGVLAEVPEKKRASITPVANQFETSALPASAKTATQQAKAATPAKNSKGWMLHTDAKGNRAYVSPDGKNYEEVK